MKSLGWLHSALLLVISATCFLPYVIAFDQPSTERAFLDFHNGMDVSPILPRNHLLSRTTTYPSICANIIVSYRNNGATYTNIIRESACYCATGGAYTTASNSEFDRAFATGSTAINQTALNDYAARNSQTRAKAVSDIKAGVLAMLNGKTTNCTYPANSEPVCSGTIACPYTCKSGYKACGSTCITTSSTCASGSSKRELRKECAGGWEVCHTGLATFGNHGNGWEYVDTQNDMESCGGCHQPMEGFKKGRDCTAILGANSVSCHLGQCQISSCLRGFKLDIDKCTKVSLGAHHDYHLLTNSSPIAAKTRTWSGGTKGKLSPEKVHPKRPKITGSVIIRRKSEIY